VSHPFPASSLRAAAEEAKVLFDCLGALAEEVLEAAERGDEAALGEALDERDRVTVRLEPLLEALIGARRRGVATAEVDEVAAAAVAVQAADARLAGRLAEIRGDIARELDRMEHAGAAATAYTAHAEPRRLDLVLR